MNAFASLLLISTLTFPTPMLMLRSGKQIRTDGSVSIDNGRVLFRSGGALYSIPEGDVDLDASRSITSPLPIVRAESGMKLKVTPEERARLLKELEQNHSGSPSDVPIPVATRSELSRGNESPQEWEWKERAQAYEERIRQAHEELDLLRDRVDQLQNRVRSLLLQGFKPQQFTYDTSQLEFTRDQIPNAELKVRRTEREYEQFLDNARRQGVLPGWLR